MLGLTSRILRGLPKSRTARTFIIIAFIDAFGRGFFLAGATVFYTQDIHLTAAQVGLGLSLAGLCGVLGALPIGRFADRIGPSRMLTAIQLWRAAAFFAYPFANDFHFFLVIACLVGLVEQAVGPIIQSLAGATAGNGSMVTSMAVIAVSRNAAYALSALVATMVLTFASATAYFGFVIANAVAMLTTAMLLPSLRLTSGAAFAVAGPRDFHSHLLPLKQPRFLLLSLANGVLYLHTVILSVALPLWVIERLHGPRGIIGAALFINTVLAVTLQVRLSARGDQIVQAGRKQRIAGMVLVASCVLMAVAGSTAGALASALVLLASVPLTLGEVWQSAGSWGISYGFSAEQNRTYYLSVYQLGSIVMTVAGPALLSIGVVNNGTAGWLGLGVVFLLTGMLVPILVGSGTIQVSHQTQEAVDPPDTGHG